MAGEARPPDRWLVAVGGNALADPHEPQDLLRQDAKAAALAAPLADLLAKGIHLVIVHGNGPQVGARLIQSEAAAAQVPPSPLHVCVAETQGQMGHHLALALANELRRRALAIPVVALVTHVSVDPGAPEFQRPDKPIGPIYPEAEARRLANERDWQVAPVHGGWRRVVPSPRPASVLEEPAIERLLESGACVIAGGGGGIPVVSSDASFTGVGAVVDKDYTAERLATALRASRLVILTDVPGAALSFESDRPHFLDRMTASEARRHLDRGEFAPGSMAPKVEACVEFVEAGGREAVIAVIAATADAAGAIAGITGTRVVPA